MAKKIPRLGCKKITPNEQNLWLADHPEKTVADFKRVSAIANANPDPSIAEARAAAPEVRHFWAWQAMQDMVAEGYFRRVTHKSKGILPKGDWE
jgi:mannose/cellobiose epimerase-like protein (N-acyl-D-glucosamine 2-epimerase family)